MYIMLDKADKRFDKLTLLAKSETRFPDSPSLAFLETFDNMYKQRNYEITFNCPEFTSLCPVTGQPDFGDITVRYIPDELCVESKSMKIFLFSFRNHNTFHEEAVNKILDEIVDKAKPKWCEVVGEFRPRGGIALSVKAEFKKTGN